MKLKRILALVVSLAMVLSIVPSLGITASATAPTPPTDKFSMVMLEKLADDGTVVFEETGETYYNDDAVTNWSGWQSAFGTGGSTNNANLITRNHDTLGNINVLQFFYQGGGSAGLNITASEDVAAATANKDYIILEFVTWLNWNGAYETGNFTFYSTRTDGSRGDGNTFLKFLYTGDGIAPNRTAAQTGDTWGAVLPGTNENGTKVRAYIAKNSNGDYSVIWATKRVGEENWTKAYTPSHTLAASKISGGFGIWRNYATSNGSWGSLGFGNVKIYAGDYSQVADPDASVKIVYKDGETEVYSETIENLYSGYTYVPDIETGTYYASEDQQKLYIVGEPDVTKKELAQGENIITVPLTPYRAIGENIIKNPGFEDNFDNWTGQSSADSGFKALNECDNGFYINTDAANVYEGSKSLKTPDRNSSYPWIDTYWSVEENTDYYASLRLKTTNLAKSNQYAWFYAGDSANIISDGDQMYGLNPDKFVKKEYIVNSGENNTIGFTARWLTDSSGYYDDFQLYKIERIPAKVTVNYYTDKVEGEPFYTKDFTDGLYVSEKYTHNEPTITHNGTTYSYVDGNREIEYLLEENTLNLIYLADQPKTVDPINITTRVGIVPELPETVTAKGDSSEFYNLAVVWDENNEKVPSDDDVADGYVIKGHLADYDSVKVTVNVTVKTLEELLIVDYEFDDNSTKDSTKNGYNAIVTGSVTYENGTIVLPGTSKTAGYLTLPDSATNDIMDAADNGGFTVVASVKKGDPQNQFLFSMHGTNEQAYERAFGLIDSDSLRFEGTPMYQATIPTRKIYTTVDRSKADTEFVNIIMTVQYDKNGLGTLKFYVDGEDVTNTANGVNLTDGKIDFTPRDVKDGSLDSLYSFIGFSPYPYDNDYKGSIDDFKIYGVALTQDEVKEVAGVAEYKVKYVCGGDEVYADAREGLAKGVTFAEKYIYYNGKVYYLPEVSLPDESGKTSVEVEVEAYYYRSHENGGEEAFMVGGKFYTYTGNSVVVNGDFKTGTVEPWTDRNGNSFPGSVVSADLNGETVNALNIYHVYQKNPSAHLGQVWTLEPDTTYYISFEMANLQGGYASLTPTTTASAAREAATTDISKDDADLLKSDWEVTSDWKRYETIYTTPVDGTPYITLAFAWMENAKLANVEIVPVEEAKIEVEVTDYNPISDVTVIDGNTPLLPKTVTLLTNVDGYTITAPVTWNTDELTVGDGNTVTGTVEGYADIKPTVKVTVLPQTFALNNGGELKYTNGYGEHNFPVPVYGEVAFEFDIKWNVLRNGDQVIGIGNSHLDKDNWAVGHTPIQLGGANTKFNATNAGDVQIALGKTYRVLITTTVAERKFTWTVIDEDGNIMITQTGDYRTDDKHNGEYDNAGTLDKLILFSNGSGGQEGDISVTNFRVCAPAAAESLTTYTINYSFSDGTSASDHTDVNGAELPTSAQDSLDGIKGYGDEVIYPNVPIPYIPGYVFSEKKPGTGEVTLAYTKTNLGEETKFFKDHTDLNAPFISLNMLGAHDAFTSELDGNKADAAGVAQGAKSAIVAANAIGSSTGAASSKSQYYGAYELLEKGVRYFDIRVSRSDKSGEGSYNNGILDRGSATVTKNTNGVFYTIHGYLSDEFAPTMYTIAQWAKEHPGEIIVLDFQEAYDNVVISTDGVGNATADTWRAIDSILSESGVNDLVTLNNGSDITKPTYGSLTSEGAESNIVLFGRYVATNANVGKFILRAVSRQGTNGLFNGKLYSNYDTNVSIGTSFSATYINGQIAQMEAKDVGNEHAIASMFRVMQAQSEPKTAGIPTSLLRQSPSDNKALRDALKENSYSNWLTYLPVIMINGVGYNDDGATTEIISILQSCNEAQDVTVNLSGAVSGTSTIKAMVGTLFTGYHSLIKGGYYVTSDTPIGVSDSVIPVPYNGSINLEVAALSDVYTIEKNEQDNKYLSKARADSDKGSGYNVVYHENIDGQYVLDPYFSAYNWYVDDGKSDDRRIGVAVLDVSGLKKDATVYTLDATRKRQYTEWCNGSETDNLYFHAMTYEAYKELDLSDFDTICEAIYNSKLIHQITLPKVAGNDNRTDTAVSLVLDKDELLSVVNASDSGKIVIFGDNHGGLYRLSNDMEINGRELGVELIDGAQVRVGAAYQEDGTVDLNRADSGLRFIGQISKTADEDGSVVTLAEVAGAKIGVEIIPEDLIGTDNATVVDIAIDKKYDNGIFTAVLINLNEGNYNRVFAATPYVEVDTVRYYGTSVERSIYEVSAGLLVKPEPDNSVGDDYVYSITKDVAAVLNAYVNAVGVQFDWDKSGNKLPDNPINKSRYAFGKKDSDEPIFFDVKAEAVDTKGYLITISPAKDDDGNATKVVLDPKVFLTNLRISNNNKTVVTFITPAEEAGNNYYIETANGTDVNGITYNEDSGEISFYFNPAVSSSAN